RTDAVPPTPSRRTRSARPRSRLWPGVARFSVHCGRRCTRMELPRELSVREGYAAWAACYDDDGNPLVALEGPVVRAWMEPARGLRARDLGCGTGRHTLALSEAGARVVALDQSPEMLARARRKLRGHNVAWVRHALPAGLPFAAGTFDLAVLGLVAEHVA